MGLLLFLGALFWAKAQDPFTRHWFTLKTPARHSFQCVRVLPKPVRRCPVVIYAHGSGGTLMTDGNDLRQMAELGLATVSREYDQTSETNFAAEFATLHHYVARQPWADTNAMAWVGFSLGAKSGVSVRTLERHFLKQMGKPPKLWLAEQRQLMAIELLRNGSTVKEAAGHAGYEHASTFSREFKKHWGNCPATHYAYAQADKAANVA